MITETLIVLIVVGVAVVAYHWREKRKLGKFPNVESPLILERRNDVRKFVHESVVSVPVGAKTDDVLKHNNRIALNRIAEALLANGAIQTIVEKEKVSPYTPEYKESYRIRHELYALIPEKDSDSGHVN